MRKPLRWMVPVIGLLFAGAALAQANTGKITGKVTSEGQPLPGVTVTATSPSLQGSRVDVSRETGEFLLVQLPAGDYELVFDLDGFSAVRMPVKVNVNQVAEVNQAMTVSGVTEEIVVTGEIDTISTETQSQTTYEQEMIEELAITRSIEDTVVLAPGVHATGPRRQAGINDLAISISGAPSYENLMMVNGVVVNENTRGQAIEFVIEDAVQETTISTSGISAQYGRFNGGVVNVITRSGGTTSTARSASTSTRRCGRARTSSRPTARTTTPTRPTRAPLAASSGRTTSGSSSPAATSSAAGRRR